MRKILLIAMLIVPMICLGQTHKVYAQIVGETNISASKVGITLIINNDKIKMKELVDKSGKEIEFSQMSAAINFMVSIGWKFEQYTVFGGNGAEYTCIISKEVNNDAEIKEGIKTKDDFKNKK